VTACTLIVLQYIIKNKEYNLMLYNNYLACFCLFFNLLWGLGYYINILIKDGLLINLTKILLSLMALIF